MHPIILDLPFGFSIKAYGLMMMLGFFAATWWAMHRAGKVKADPDVILNLGFISLISGIVGARILYVIQYWEKDFALEASPLWAVIDITKGGLVFYGGFLGAVICSLIYLVWAKHSVRLYLDILAPSLMLGLAFGRTGCFLNGCCWGAPTERVPWAIQFPYASPGWAEHYHRGLVDVPQQLLIRTGHYPVPVALDREHLNAPADLFSAPQRRIEQANEALAKARQDKADKQTIENLQAEADAAKARFEKIKRTYADLYRVYETYGQTPSEVTAMASHYHSRPVHPTQLYAIVDALLLAGLLHIIFMRRRQQGVVFGLVFIFYGIGRFVEEMIRGDNPREHLFGMLTISQMISLATFLLAIVYLAVLYKLPAASPAAIRVVPADPPQEPVASK